jgi:hypothetical protein
MVKFNMRPMWLRLGMILSGTAYAVLLMQTDSKLSFGITGILAFALMTYLVLRTGFLEAVFSEKPMGICAVAAVLSLSAVYTGKSSFYHCCAGWLQKLMSWLGLPRPELLLRICPWVLALVALPMAFGYFLWFLDFMWTQAKRFWVSSDFAERLFLLGAGVLFTVVICFSYHCTQAFYGAHVNGSWYNFDLIYSADSGYLVTQDVFRNVGAEQNDLRQPLFGVFAMPFAQAAWLISKVLFFLPHGYVTVLQILEMLLFLIALVLIARMMGLQGAEKVLLLCLMCVSYPVLIFSLTAEQYLFAVFYLVLLIYLQEDKEGQALSYIGATGCMLTSGLFFPLVTWHKSLREFVGRTVKLCGAFFAVTILSGRLTTFLDIPSYIAGYGYYTGADVPMLSKLMQYVNFVSATLAAPASQMDFETYNHVSWQMCPVTNWQWSGILVLLLAVLGVAVRPKDRFSRICGAWMGFSLLLLGLIGWGTIDNGLLLYSLYFGWAFVAMSFQLIDRLFARVRPLKLAVLVAAVLVIGAINVTALKAVLVFATQFYPALR